MTCANRQNAVCLLTLSLIGLASMPAWAQDGETAKFLQQFPRELDRRDLEKNIAFAGEDGITRRGVRCATRPVGQFERTIIDAALGDVIAGQGRWHRYGAVSIPLVFHVASTPDGTGHLKKKLIKRQVRVLNRAYATQGFAFELQAVRRYEGVDFAANCLDVDVERDFKSSHAVDPVHTLNVYTCLPEDRVLGYSYHPWDFTEDSFMHGVVLLYSTFPYGSAAPFNEGDTLVHEVGHYLGLFHTFEGACSDGDRVEDTPAEQSPAYGCPAKRDTCSEPGMDPIHNYMNYSDDACMNEFTPDQMRQMQDAIATFHSGL